jgi:hypothetical protein
MTMPAIYTKHLLAQQRQKEQARAACLHELASAIRKASAKPTRNRKQIVLFVEEWQAIVKAMEKVMR